MESANKSMWMGDRPQTEPSPSTGVAPLTFGQQLVGLTFNPSGDDKVARAKLLCAELADLVHEDFTFGAKTFLKNELYSHTIGEILNAQMNVVKVVQKYTDSAITKTVKVDTKCSYDEYEQIYLYAFESGLKGITVFRPS